MIVVTDFDVVDVDDFYLTDEKWTENIEDIKELRELAKDGQLYYAYEIDAENYTIYQQMDARQVFIDDTDDIRMICEGEIIGNRHKHCFKSN